MIARELKSGMKVDLEGDKYVTEFADVAMAEYQLAVVDTVTIHGDTVTVDFEEHTSLWVWENHIFNVVS